MIMVIIFVSFYQSSLLANVYPKKIENPKKYIFVALLEA